MRMEEKHSLEVIGKQAKEAEGFLRTLSTNKKNNALQLVSDFLIQFSSEILKANKLDMTQAAKNQMKEGLMDRLLLTEDRIKQMAEGIRQIIALDDPIGKIPFMEPKSNGLVIGQKRVPLGVVGIIYEARPNVTADAFGLCFKTGNVVILKGGSDALESNKAIVSVIQKALAKENIPQAAIQLIADTDRAVTTAFMSMNQYVDVLIPRGGAGLIRTVVENAKIPVIETGTGNCHIFVDQTADLETAVQIIFNAKTQRIGVCNACESLVIHEAIAQKALPRIVEKLKEKNVEIRGDETSRGICCDILAASFEDWGTEYLDYIISVKIVADIDEAIAHINKYNTGHSEAILTESYQNAQKFLNEVDAAAVYVNASTRFTDGFEFGLGAEIGISTQKLHARGPMGLEALTSTKYIIYGAGQIRE